MKNELHISSILMTRRSQKKHNNLITGGVVLPSLYAGEGRSGLGSSNVKNRLHSRTYVHAWRQANELSDRLSDVLRLWHPPSLSPA